ncbi:glycerophosphodiester phosphodiesterase [Nocardioides mangrovicus]|uniref:glycerophosphodiester phosphodiesterase n=1 Tax=Nocardioides mangrovicus TaxID=2478913 RepID=UPI001314BE18|nr:glycerophosphodiester phosphodiesterase [Nocardioides mangrovicus]
MRLRLLLAVAVGLLPALGAVAPAQAADSAQAHRPRLAVAFPHTMVRGKSAAVRVRESTARRHRLLRVSYRPSGGGTWRLAATARETKRGKARIRFALPATGSYLVRVDLARYRQGQRTVRARKVYDTVKAVPVVAPAVIAHRGGAFEAPENTMAAFSRAIADGAQVLETDIHQTSDGTLVVMHDPTLRRATDAEQVLAPGEADKPIWQVPYSEVAQVSVDVGPGPAQPVPRLSDLLTLLQQHPATRLLIEAKDTTQQPNLMETMLAQLTAAGIDTSRSGRAVIQSFDVNHLQTFAAAHPAVAVSPILQQDVTDPRTYSWAVSITLQTPWASAAQIAAIHAAGLRVEVWLVETLPGLAAYADAGADGIITDAPAAALAMYR